MDGRWSQPIDVATPMVLGWTIRSALAITSDGMLHAGIRYYMGHSYSSAPARFADNAANWSNILQINENGYYLALFADQYDNLHYIFNAARAGINLQDQTQLERYTCALCLDLFYRRSTDGGKTWSRSVPISEEPGSGNDRPDIFEGDSGRLYIIWDEGYDFFAGRGEALDVRMVYSNDSGINWSNPVVLDGGNFPNRRPTQLAMTELKDGSLLAVWRYKSLDDQFIYYQLSSDIGKTWSRPQPIPYVFARNINDTPLDDYELIIDRLGRVHLFAVGYINQITRSNPSAFHISYANGVWTSARRIFYSPEQRPEWPKAALGPKNDIHLTFFTRGLREDTTDFLTDTGFRIYYSYLPGNLPARLVPFKPTPTPQPTPTIAQNLLPTPTPFPTVESVTDPARGTTTDNYAAETVLSGSFAAALGCAMIALAIRRVRRR